MKNLICFFSILVICFMFCQTKEAETSEVRDVLLATSWIESEHWSDHDKDGVFQLDTIPTCVNDDSWTFLTNFVIEHRDLGEICDTTVLPDFYTGIWRLQDDDNTLYVEYDPDFVFNYYKIADFTESMIELWYFDINHPADQVTEKLILRKP